MKSDGDLFRFLFAFLLNGVLWPLQLLNFVLRCTCCAQSGEQFVDGFFRYLFRSTRWLVFGLCLWFVPLLVC